MNGLFCLSVGTTEVVVYALVCLMGACLWQCLLYVNSDVLQACSRCKHLVNSAQTLLSAGVWKARCTAQSDVLSFDRHNPGFDGSGSQL